MILKLLSGGTAPWVQYLPVTVNTASSGASGEDSKKSSSSSSSKDDGKITNKDLLTMLKDIDGLPSDMLSLYDNLVNFMRMSEIDGDLDPSMLNTYYIRSLQMVKTAKYRKERWEDAYKTVENNKGLNEIAIMPSGLVLGMNNSGDIKYFAPGKVDEGYTLLTNSDLLNLRANNIRFANSDTLPQIVSNGIGLEKVNELIHNYITTLGSDEEKISGFYRNPGQRIIEGYLQAVKQIASLQGISEQEAKLQIAKAYQEAQKLGQGAFDESGLYKGTKITKQQLSLVNSAMVYIFGMLPKNAKSLLLAKCDGDESKVYTLINSLLTSRSSSTFESSWDLVEDENGNKPGTKESADSLKISVAALFIKGYGPLEKIVFQDGTPDGMILTVSSLPITKGGSPIGLSTANDLFSSDYGSILDTKNISIAGQIINPSNTNHIICDGRAYNVDMPLDLEALKRGEIKPDLELLRKKKEAEKIIEDNNYTSILDKNRIYLQQGLPIKYKPNGELNTESWTTFAAFNVTAYSGIFPDLDGITFSRYATELSGTEEDSALAFINQHNGKEGGIPNYDKKNIPLIEGRGHWYLNNSDAMYQTTMWIPIYDNVVSTLGPATKKQLNETTALDLQNLRIKTTHEDRTLQ